MFSSFGKLSKVLDISKYLDSILELCAYIDYPNARLGLDNLWF